MIGVETKVKTAVFFIAFQKRGSDQEPLSPGWIPKRIAAPIRVTINRMRPELRSLSRTALMATYTPQAKQISRAIHMELMSQTKPVPPSMWV